MSDTEREWKGRDVPLWQALIPVAALIALLTVNIVVYKGDPHLPLVLASAMAGAIGVWRGCPWHVIERGIVEGIRVGLIAILILLVIGMMIGTWIAAGIVPTLIYWGLQLLSAKVFLVAACMICCVVSLATGSSWTTAGTVGVALVGVGGGLGVPLPMVAGAIVSGAYFGDKMSPLSDSTNLAPAVAGAELFEHIRHMVYTTIPALIIAFALYGILGMFFVSGESDLDKIRLIQDSLAAEFRLHWALLLPPLMIVALVAYRIPALPALMGGVLVGGGFAMAFQSAALGDVLAAAHYGYVAETGVEAVDKLLSGGGLESMMSTVALILCALTFGGIMERTGMLRAIAGAILRLATTTGRLIASTVGTCMLMNVIAPDQYLSIIVPGRMYREAFLKKQLHAKNLSRCLEDGGTLSSPLVPWNTCGAYMWSTLGVYPLAYLPFAFFNLLSPLISVLIGFAGWKLAALPPERAEAAKDSV